MRCDAASARVLPGPAAVIGEGTSLMLPCFRCGASAVGVDGVCANCGMCAFESPYATPSVVMRPRRNVKGLGVSLMVALGVCAAAIVALAVAEGWRHQLTAQKIDALNGAATWPEQ